MEQLFKRLGAEILQTRNYRDLSLWSVLKMNESGMTIHVFLKEASNKMYMEIPFLCEEYTDLPPGLQKRLTETLNEGSNYHHELTDNWGLIVSHTANSEVSSAGKELGKLLAYSAQLQLANKLLLSQLQNDKNASLQGTLSGK